MTQPYPDRSRITGLAASREGKGVAITRLKRPMRPNMRIKVPSPYRFGCQSISVVPAHVGGEISTCNCAALRRKCWCALELDLVEIRLPTSTRPGSGSSRVSATMTGNSLSAIARRSAPRIKPVATRRSTRRIHTEMATWPTSWRRARSDDRGHAQDLSRADRAGPRDQLPADGQGDRGR